MTSTTTLPDPPAQLKAIQSYMKIAQDVERVDPIVSYWVRLYSTETALKIDRESPECKTFLSALILWLEQFKSTRKDNETITNQTVGQAHMENFIMALFNRADTLDREGTANKNTVRMFYMAAVLFEATAVFGPLTDDILQKAKYAKFKAAYIQKCLKTGQTPKPGPVEGTDLENGGESAAPPQPQLPSSGGILDIPEVPTDTDKDERPKQDPYIMSPSQPPLPSMVRPAQPPTTSQGSNLSMNESMQSRDVKGGTSDCSRSTINDTRFLASNGVALKPEDIIQGQKYCKFANSALQYDDIPTAVANLEKALKLLTTGQKSD